MEMELNKPLKKQNEYFPIFKTMDCIFLLRFLSVAVHKYDLFVSVNFLDLW